MIAVSTGFTIEGILAQPVRVEVDVQRGLPSFQIIGLPDQAVREMRERIRSALTNSGFDFPLRRITVNLQPAELRKAGPALDLPIAAALLVAAGEISADAIDGWAAAGELALDGSLRPVRGALAMAEAARAEGCHGILVAPPNGPEAGMAYDMEACTITNVSELRGFGVDGKNGEPAEKFTFSDRDNLPDLADLRGQRYLCRALEVAAAGGHGLLMVGPPGSGKSLAARRLPSILPPLDGVGVLERAHVASAAGIGLRGVSTDRPFRAPHHTVSATGLVGGGNPTRLGEVTMAHKGVLFLDELTEFRRATLEALKQPLETGEVEIARGHSRTTLPAEIQLVAAANPCPCGRGETDPRCECSESSIRRYRSALDSGLTDRIDIHIAVAQPDAADMAGSPGETSAVVRRRVIAARGWMNGRYGWGRVNASATAAEVAQFNLTAEAREAISGAQSLSGRSAERVLKVARTIADLANRPEIRAEDINQAFAYTSRQQPTPV